MKYTKILAAIASLSLTFAAQTAAAYDYQVKTTVQGSGDTEYTFSFDIAPEYNDANCVILRDVRGKLTDKVTLSSLYGYYDTDGTFKELILKEIGDGVFKNSQGLLSITLPDTCIKIGDYVFSNCTSLATVELNSGLRYIGKRPFVNTAIAEITVPDTVINMDGNIAAGTLYSAEIIISDSSHFTYGEDGCLYNEAMTRLYACPTRAKGSIELADSLKEILPDAFFGCFNISNITIGASVTDIGSKAFNVTGIWPGLSAPESGSKLKSVTFKGVPPANVASDAFEGAPSDVIIYVDEKNLASWPTTWFTYPVQKAPEEGTTVEEGIYTKKVGDITWTYKVDESGVATIREGTFASAQDVDIPEKLDGTPIRRLYNSNSSYGIFSGVNDQVLSITLPSSITNIGEYAFSDCTAMSFADLSAATKLEAIEYEAFYGCSMLETLEIPESVNNIGSYAFSHCTSLTDIILPNKLTSLGSSAFSGCSMLQAIEMPVDLKFIAKSTFSGCSALTKIALPSNLTSIAQYAFNDCSSLKTITLPKTLTSLSAYAFDGCTSLTEVTFEGGIPSGLKNSRILANVTNINCPEALADVFKNWLKDNGYTCTVNNVGEPEKELKTDGTWYYHIVNDYAELWRTNGVGKNVSALVDRNTIGDLTLPAKIGGYIVKSVAKCALANLRGITAVSIPSTYETIGDYVFSNCTSLASVTIPDSVRRLGKNPFYGSALTALTIPSSLTTLDGNPLVGCPLATDITANNTAFKSEDGLLYNATKTTLLACVPNKTEVTIPESVTAIADDAFAGCANLTKITFEGNAPTVNVDVLADAPNAVVEADTYLKTWPAIWSGRAITNIGGMYDDGTIIWSYTVAGNTATIIGVRNNSETPIKSLSFPSTIGKFTVTTIGEGAASNNISLASVTIPTSVRRLGKNPFYGSALTALAIPSSLTTLDGNPLVGCPLATDITADNTAFKSEDGLLYNATKTTLLACVPNKTEVTIPESVTAIADDAFAGCANLTKITFEGNAPTVNVDVLADAPNAVVEADTYLKTWPAIWSGRAITNIGGMFTDAYGNIWRFTIANDVATITELLTPNASLISTLLLPTEVTGKYLIKTLGNAALANLKGITEITIPETYDSIGDYAFSNCTSLASVTIGSGVSKIGKAPFYNTKIDAIYLPKNLIQLDGNPIAGCSKVEILNSDSAAFKTENGLLFNNDKTMLLACAPKASQTDYTLEVTIPASVTAIADDTFAGCTHLTNVTFAGNEPTASENIFANTPTTLTVNADAYLHNWGNPVPTSWKNRKFVDIGDNGTPHTDGIWTYSITKDGNAAIGENCAAISTSTKGALTISETLGSYSVAIIGAKAFNDCDLITSITIPASVTNIDSAAFIGCAALKSFTVSSDNPSYTAKNGVLYTKDGKTLVKVPAAMYFNTTITETVNSINQNVVELPINCTIKGETLPSVVLKDGNTTTSTSSTTTTFTPNVSAATLLSGVTKVADYAFADCGYLPAGSTVTGTVEIRKDGTRTYYKNGDQTISVGTDSEGGEAIQSAVTNQAGFYTYGGVKRTANWNTVTTSSSYYSAAVTKPDLSGKTYNAQTVWYNSWWETHTNTQPVNPTPISTDGDTTDQGSQGSQDSQQSQDDSHQSQQSQESQTKTLAGTTTSVQSGALQTIDTGISSATAKSVSAKGLPTGLKLVKTTNSKGLTEWVIQGTATKAMSKVVTLTVTNYDRTKDYINCIITTKAAPAWLSGEYNGAIYDDANSSAVHGSATAKITAAGKISGKILMPSDDGAKAKSYSFSVKSFTNYDDATESFKGVATIKIGTVKENFIVTCAKANDGTGTGVLTIDLGRYGVAELYQNIWKRKDLSAPNTLIGRTLLVDGITYKVSANGKVKWSGQLMNDLGKSVKVSGSTQLFNDGRTVLLYIPPKKNLTSQARLVDLGGAAY